MTYKHCNGKHALRVITRQYGGADGVEDVVRWCENCGAVVEDVDVDGRTQPGGGQPMRFPAIAASPPQAPQPTDLHQGGVFWHLGAKS